MYVGVAVFLLCWAPFFTVNIVNAICIRYVASCDSDSSDDCRRSCQVDSSLMTSFVWLGYANSALNPIIYYYYYYYYYYYNSTRSSTPSSTPTFAAHSDDSYIDRALSSQTLPDLDRSTRLSTVNRSMC